MAFRKTGKTQSIGAFEQNEQLPVKQSSDNKSKPDQDKQGQAQQSKEKWDSQK